ncbi:hypothetical protein OROHE_027045 [Orobanche hederae]
MGIIYEDAVLIKEVEIEGGQTVITVNCPDKTGLGCDLCRVILFFGLSIARGVGGVTDVSTDGKWCYLVFWVVGKPTTKWNMLKERLLDACPHLHLEFSTLFPSFSSRGHPKFSASSFGVFMTAKAFCMYVTVVLYELELTIKRVKVYTAPDGRVMDLFFITDTRELLQTSNRREETIRRLKFVIGDTMMTCNIEPAGPEVASCLQSLLPSSVSENIFGLPVSRDESSMRVLVPESVSIAFDNSLSPSHTLVQIFCQDHKGLIYDVMRTLKDYNIQISYGRFFATAKGNCEMDLFVMQDDGKKIIDTHKRTDLCSRLEMELVHPLRVDVVSRGPDTELLVVNPVELSGRASRFL